VLAAVSGGQPPSATVNPVFALAKRGIGLTTDGRARVRPGPANRTRARIGCIPATNPGSWASVC